jgi:hypothetical protein
MAESTRIDVFLKTLGADTANGGGNGGGNGVMSKVFSKGNKDIKNELEKGNKGDKKGLGATLGIKFGIASLLKQSQVFTGFVGTIFQLMGALVDVILAPFLPILIPGIRLIADMVPYVAKYARAVYDFLDRTIFGWFSGLGWFDGVGEAVKKALSAILVGVIMLKITGLYNVAKSLLTNFLGKPLWGLLQKMFPQIDTLMSKFEGKSFMQIIKSAGKAALRTIFRGWWDTLLIKLMFFSDFLQAPFKLLWKSLQVGIKAEGEGLVQLLVRKLWTEGLNARLVTPLMTRLTGIGTFLASPFKSLWKAIAGDFVATGDGMLVRVLNVIKEWPAVKMLGGLSQHLTRLFDWIPTMIKNVVKDLPVVNAIMAFIKKKIGGLFSGALKLLKGAVGKADAGRALLAKAPGSGMIASMARKLSPTEIANIGKGFKAIPILGAVAELGFGGWQTYKDYKKYGAKAAMGRAGLTLANTTAALFDPTGLVSAGASIGTNIAMDQLYKRNLDPKDSWKRANPDIWIRYEDTNGVEQYRRKDEQDRNNGVNAGRGQMLDKTSLDGIMY